MGSNKFPRTHSIISSYHLVDGHARPTTLPRSGRLRQSRLRQAFDDALKISGVLVRQDAFALRQREIRIHFEKLRPRRACVVRAPEMAVAGCQKHPAGVGARGACDAVDVLLRSSLENLVVGDVLITKR